MVYTENAKLMEVEEIKELMDEECSSPTVDRLMFIETRAKGDIPSKVFPCYFEAYGCDNSDTDAKVTVFQVCIAQSTGGQFGMVRVVVPISDFGVTKRIWDKPPKKALRDSIPWATLEGGVQ